MRQQLFDITDLSDMVGHPNIFLTLIRNPKWKEVTKSLPPGQMTLDRPDVSGRGFKLKLEAPLHLASTEELLSTTLASV